MRRRAFITGAGVAGGAAMLGFGPRALDRPAAAKPAAPGPPLARLARAGITVAGQVTRYAGARPVAALELPMPRPGTTKGEAGGATWTCSLRAAPVKGQPDAVELTASFKLVKGRAPEASVGLVLALASWSRDDYVLMPGACYAGNRFESRHTAYPPLLSEPADIGPNVPTIVSDIPRLNLHDGPSRVQLLAGDLATPAIGVHAAAARRGLLVLCDPSTPAGVSGLSVEESADRARATLAITAPGVREEAMYAPGTTRLPSKDRGATFRAGDTITLRARVHLFDCLDVPALFARLAAVRKDLTGSPPLRHELPFSAAWKAHEERVNQRWVESPGYFAVGNRDGAYATWQTGWNGGLVTTLPLLALGTPRSRERALRNLQLAFAKGQAPSGFFHGVFDGKEWSEDGFAAAARAPAYKHARRWHLVRRSADALAFLAKQLLLLERADAGHPDLPKLPDVPELPEWRKGLGRCADAFVRLWDRYRQLGQFVNVDTGALVVGGSTAAGMAPAGLALAAALLKKDDYLRVATAAALQMFDRYLRAGVTCGAPGDVLQCPDSQSAVALLESFVTLHEQTGDSAWVDRAVLAARQLASWVISSDVHPLGGGAGGGGGIDTTGAVLSDAQSKHGSPGYALASGDALLRLYRATGDAAHLELLRDTVHNLAQYLPRAEAAARLPAGAAAVAAGTAAAAASACARADTSDWLEPTGDIIPVASLYDTASLLAYAEVPGIYARVDRDFVFAFDHVDARVKEASAERLVVSVSNPTKADASVRLLAETTPEAARPLAPGAVALLPPARVLTVPTGGTIEVELPKRPATP